MTMFYSYTGWEKSILECIAETDDQATSAEALASIENWDIGVMRETPP